MSYINLWDVVFDTTYGIEPTLSVCGQSVLLHNVPYKVVFGTVVRNGNNLYGQRKQ